MQTLFIYSYLLRYFIIIRALICLSKSLKSYQLFDEEDWYNPRVLCQVNDVKRQKMDR